MENFKEAFIRCIHWDLLISSLTVDLKLIKKQCLNILNERQIVIITFNI